jgi:hypothetical protein
MSVAVLCVSGALALAAPAAHAVTIGQLPATVPTPSCSSNTDRAMLTVADGNSYTVPSTGGVTNWTLTSWSHFATTNATQQLTMKVFRKVSDPTTYMVVAHDGPRDLTPSQINTFNVNVPVKAGDILGLNGLSSPSSNACIVSTANPADTYLTLNPGVADGQTAVYGTNSQFRMNISGEVTPTNTFAVGTTTRNKKKGTATVSFDLPNPGELSGSGTGATVSSAGATISKSVTAGTAQLVIRATGKKLRKLKSKGKVQVSPTITYQPTGGAASSQTLTVKLKKKRKKA